MKQISEVEEKPFTSSLNISLVSRSLFLTGMGAGGVTLSLLIRGNFIKDDVTVFSPPRCFLHADTSGDV